MRDAETGHCWHTESLSGWSNGFGDMTRGVICCDCGERAEEVTRQEFAQPTGHGPHAREMVTRSVVKCATPCPAAPAAPRPQAAGDGREVGR